MFFQKVYSFCKTNKIHKIIRVHPNLLCVAPEGDDDEEWSLVHKLWQWAALAFIVKKGPNSHKNKKDPDVVWDSMVRRPLQTILSLTSHSLSFRSCRCFHNSFLFMWQKICRLCFLNNRQKVQNSDTSMNNTLSYITPNKLEFLNCGHV